MTKSSTQLEYELEQAEANSQALEEENERLLETCKELYAIAELAAYYLPGELAESADGYSTRLLGLKK